jgi:hypothetical protein
MNPIALFSFSVAMAAASGVAAAPAGTERLASAQIEKWVDTNGQVHYGDAPPPEANASPLRLQPNVIDVDQPAAQADTSVETDDRPLPAAASMTVPPERPDIDRYVAHCRDNRGVDCELEARQMIDGPAPVLFPGDPAIFPRPDLKPPPPGLPLKYSIPPVSIGSN